MADRKSLTQEELKAKLSYSPDTGIFTRINGLSVRGATGSLSDYGYVRIQIGARCYFAHHLAWLYMTGHFPDQIDHINGVRDDNRFTNLRLASARENSRNKKLKRNVCGTKGVSKHYRKFRASIKVDFKSIYLGLYSTVDEAAHAYNKAAIKYFGDFACLNPIGQDK